MIKKVAHIAVVVLLLLATTGVTVFKHYCGNSLISKTIGYTEKHCCTNGHCNSCHNDSQSFKINDDFESSNYNLDFKSPASSILDTFLNNVLIGLSTAFSPSAVYLIYHRTYIEPPLLAAMDQCARLQVYRL